MFKHAKPTLPGMLSDTGNSFHLTTKSLSNFTAVEFRKLLLTTREMVLIVS